jgi:hypothetical protein
MDDTGSAVAREVNVHVGATAKRDQDTKILLRYAEATGRKFHVRLSMAWCGALAPINNASPNPFLLRRHPRTRRWQTGPDGRPRNSASGAFTISRRQRHHGRCHLQDESGAIGRLVQFCRSGRFVLSSAQFDPERTTVASHVAGGASPRNQVRVGPMPRMSIMPRSLKRNAGSTMERNASET